MPLTIKRTNSTSIAANSVLFDGSSQYLTLPASSNWAMTGDFTVECWVNTNLPSGGSGTILSLGSNSSAYAGLRFQITRASSGATPISLEILIATNGGSWGLTGQTSAVMVNGIWNHVAVVRSGGVVTAYMNGVGYNIGTVNGTLYTGPYNSIGKLDGYSNPFYYNGYISNLRIVNGTAVYTSNFTPPTSPLTAIANTSLLTCNAPTIVDSSTNNFTITNNNSATVSSLSPTFRALSNNFQFARRTSTLSGRSVQFDGTNDYLSLVDNANLRIGTSQFCIEAWIYLNALPDKSVIFGKRTYNGTGTGTYLFRVNSTGDLLLQELQNVTTIVNATAAIQTNTWYHVAVSRDASNNVRLFVNGTVVSTATSTFNFSSTEPLWIGKDNAALQLLLNGYISNLRFVIGNPVYTASFTPTTTPLTAIANTALLTCNADTIVDSSTNNFTITNNNGATVSSTSPFVASSGGMSLKKVYADPITYMVATGGDLVTTSGSYKIHTFTTVGTSSFVVSSVGAVTSVECLLVAGGGGGGYGSGGGGGAGGVIYSSSYSISAGSYNVVIGDGGLGNTGSSVPTSINDGKNSTFATLTALGGGGGGGNGGSTRLANNGGSGGGLGHSTGTVGTGLQPSSTSGGYGNNGALVPVHRHITPVAVAVRAVLDLPVVGLLVEVALV